MSLSIASSFSSPFGVSGDLGLGTASILGTNATATPNAASVGTAADPETGDFAALSSALTSGDQSPTIEALQEGKLTSKQQQVIQAIGSSANNSYDIAWNSDGTEPTVLAQIRGYGWIKINKPDYDPKTREDTGATYSLTSVGKAIFQRTSGGKVSATGNLVNLST